MGNAGCSQVTRQLPTNKCCAVIICYSELLSVVLPAAENDPLWFSSSFQADATTYLPGTCEWLPGLTVI